MKEFSEKYNLSKFYAYHQIPRENNIVEFGWVEANEIPLYGPIIISRAPDYPDNDNAVTLADYREYFLKLTSFAPDDFLDKWEPSPREFELFWYADKPDSEPGLHGFIVKLAYLIRDEKDFEHKFEKHNVNFSVVNWDLGYEGEDQE